MSNKIILMIGGPATGKTTVLKILAKNTPIKVCSPKNGKQPLNIPTPNPNARLEGEPS